MCSRRTQNRTLAEQHPRTPPRDAGNGAGTAVVNAMLVVPQPEVQPALNTHRIALTQPENRLDYFANSRWW